MTEIRTMSFNGQIWVNRDDVVAWLRDADGQPAGQVVEARALLDGLAFELDFVEVIE